MTTTPTNPIADMLSDGVEFSWMRQRTHDELTSFIDRRHAALDGIELE